MQRSIEIGDTPAQLGILPGDAGALADQPERRKQCRPKHAGEDGTLNDFECTDGKCGGALLGVGDERHHRESEAGRSRKHVSRGAQEFRFRRPAGIAARIVVAAGYGPSRLKRVFARHVLFLSAA
ncbi:hypothetical protein MesoLjLb_11510 [Mesorhizobium sp. L-8-3]|nr:hypothetical protein MesoLjLb_11510 [Mesorhizobium sp. L-8-3]